MIELFELGDDYARLNPMPGAPQSEGTLVTDVQAAGSQQVVLWQMFGRWRSCSCVASQCLGLCACSEIADYGIALPARAVALRYPLTALVMGMEDKMMIICGP